MNFLNLFFNTYKFSYIILLFFLNQISNILLSFFYNILFYIFFYSKFKNTKIFILPTQIFGTTLQRIINYLEFIKKNKLNTKNVLFILNLDRRTNTEIFPLISNNFKAYQNNLLFHFFSKCAVLNSIHFLNTFNIKNHNASFEYNVYFKNLNFSKKQIKQKYIIKKKIGIKRKFICISNRDNYFHSGKKFNNYRNSSFKKLNTTINYLIKNNYQVVRMGHYKETQKKNYLSINKLSKNERDLADLILPSEAEFSINGVSGLNYVPRLFNKYSLIHNFIPYNLAGGLGKSIIIPKIFKRKIKLNHDELKKINSLFFDYRLDEKLTFKLIKTLNITEFQSGNLYKKNRVKIIDNSSNDILNGTKELIKIMKNKKQNQKYIKKNKYLLKNVFKNILNNNTYISKNWLNKNKFF